MQMPKLLTDLLKQTSRSFYLTLRVLPGAIRPQIGLAYLLARTADTIADSELVPLEQRHDALHKLRDRILGSSTALSISRSMSVAWMCTGRWNVGGTRASASCRESVESSSSTMPTDRLVASVTAPVATVLTDMLKA